MKITYNKIAFFGASVTKQNNSYADSLMSMVQAEYRKFGYGSMHLSDAGICFIEEVIEYKPEICLIDWFSTSRTNYDKKIFEYLDCITFKLLKNNITPIFLLFPISEMLNSRLEMYDDVKKYSSEHNIHCINVYEEFLEDKIEISQIIKDYVHTTEFGGNYYSSKIFQHLEHNVFNHPDEPLHSNYNIVCPLKNKYTEILIKELNISVKNFIDIYVEDELIGIFQTIGPYSDCVEIYKDGKILSKYPIWDVWCHYERETIKLELKEPGHYSIRLSQGVDKSKCKVQMNWHEFSNVLHLKEAFYTSNFLVEKYE